jgi:hypothetical protein
MKQHSKRTLKERIGWYPVSTFGWILTMMYVSLLLYALVQTTVDLHSYNLPLFKTAILISWLIILTMLWARFTNERPFNEVHRKK